MRTRILLISVVALALVACSTGTTAAPSPAASPSPAPVGSPSPSPAAASPSVTPLAVKVTFDGTTCSYLGPTVVPDGTPMRFEYSNSTADGGLVVGGVTSNVPANVLGAPIKHASVIPAWFDQGHYDVLAATSGALEITLTNDPKAIVTDEMMSDPNPADVAFFVGCPTQETTTDTMYPAALIWLLPK
jgi:hypothetical protein